MGSRLGTGVIFVAVSVALLGADVPHSPIERLNVDKLIDEGHFRRAQPMVAAVLDQHPQDIEALIDLSTIQYAFGHLDESIATAEKAVAANDRSAPAHAQLLNALGAKLASPKIGLMDKMGTARRFRKEADRTLELDPHNLYALEAISRFYWYAPAMGGGDKAKAMQTVGRLMQVDPARGLALRAELDATGSDKIKARAAAESDWKQAVSVRPDSYIAHAGLAKALIDNGGENPPSDGGKLLLAEDEAKKALAIDPGRATAYRLLAQCNVLTFKFDELSSELTLARNRVPDDLGARYAAADTILTHGMQAQMSLADRYLRDYLSQPVEGLEPTHAMAHWRLGLVLEKEGRKADAIQELNIAASLDTSLDGVKKDLKRLR
jgi:tetratricopeptide (TPR) repeat protein